MTDREFFLARRKVELPAFLNVLKALPADKLDYKPHENSPSAQQLAWTAGRGAAVGGRALRHRRDHASRPSPRRPSTR